MIEVFITNVKKQIQVEIMLKVLERTLPELNIDFDMDETGFPYPKGHTVLRVEGKNFDINDIILIFKKSKFMCEIMEDNITIKTTHNNVYS